MNKNIVIAIGFVLITVIGYQAYLLNKTSDAKVQIVEEKKPEISVTIEEESIEEKVKELNTPVQSQIKPDDMFDEELIKEDLNRLFSNIFGNPKLQEGIKEGFKEMQEQLQEGIKEMEKGFGELSGEIDKLSKSDPFFKDLLGEFSQANRLKFTDQEDNYYLSLNIPGGADSKVDIKTEKNLLTITITQKVIQEKQSQNSTIYSESLKKHQNTISIPDDAFIEHLKTKYQDGILEITVPKVNKIES